MDDFRAEMVSAVKAAGQQLIDQAEDIVGNAEMMSSLKIKIDFDGMEDGLFSVFSEMTIKRGHLIRI